MAAIGQRTVGPAQDAQPARRLRPARGEANPPPRPLGIALAPELTRMDLAWPQAQPRPAIRVLQAIPEHRTRDGLRADVVAIREGVDLRAPLVDQREGAEPLPLEPAVRARLERVPSGDPAAAMAK